MKLVTNRQSSKLLMTKSQLKYNFLGSAKPKVTAVVVNRAATNQPRVMGGMDLNCSSIELMVGSKKVVGCVLSLWVKKMRSWVVRERGREKDGRN
jgi:hypothetical protein